MDDRLRGNRRRILWIIALGCLSIGLLTSGLFMFVGVESEQIIGEKCEAGHLEPIGFNDNDTERLVHYWRRFPFERVGLNMSAHCQTHDDKQSDRSPLMLGNDCSFEAHTVATALALAATGFGVTTFHFGYTIIAQPLSDVFRGRNHALTFAVMSITNVCSLITSAVCVSAINSDTRPDKDILPDFRRSHSGEHLTHQTVYAGDYSALYAVLMAIIGGIAAQILMVVIAFKHMIASIRGQQVFVEIS